MKQFCIRTLEHEINFKNLHPFKDNHHLEMMLLVICEVGHLCLPHTLQNKLQEVQEN